MTAEKSEKKTFELGESHVVWVDKYFLNPARLYARVSIQSNTIQMFLTAARQRALTAGINIDRVLSLATK